VGHTCHLSNRGKHKIGGLRSRLAWAKRDPIFKITGAKRAGGVAEEVERLSSKSEALSSKPQDQQKRRDRERETHRERDRERERERERERQRERDTERDRERERNNF
jgi:hypothetical protein